jgi:hypothetical protein
MSISQDKWVRVMCDYEAEGLWEMMGAAACLDDLPVSDELKRRLVAWQDWFERDCQNYLPPSQRTARFDVPAFSKEGLSIAQSIKSELPDWNVIYFDEEKARQRRIGDPRSTFEYPITSSADIKS